MPFIFHSEKLSIFEPKPQNQVSNNNQKIQYLAPSKPTSPSPIKQMASVCKERPFRKLRELIDKLNNFQSHQFNDWNQSLIKQQRPFKKYVYKPWKVDSVDAKHQSQFDSFTQNTQNSNIFSNVGKQGARIHRQASLPKENQIKKEKVFRHIGQQSNQNQERLKYLIDQNPGPCSYDVPIVKNQKSTVLYQSPSYTVSLPQKKGNSLESILLSIEQKMPKRQERNFLLDCNYKNQNSPSFKSSILRKSTPKKNEALLGLLLSKKKSENKQNQSETTCQSRMAGTQDSQFYEDGFEKIEQKSPGPSSYDPNIDCNQENKDRKRKPFLSGDSKHLSYINRGVTPGPRSYLEETVQKRQVFERNQNKRPNKFEQNDKGPEHICAFSSAAPRELHFDTQNLCRQELYYSPKNNLSDLVQMKIEKGNRSNKVQFGSSLERFPKDQIMEDDPYKYCFAKVTNSPVNSSCPSMSFKEKRQIFKPISNTVAPNKYHDITNTIYKSTEKQLFRKLLQSKYQDEVILLKEKKKNMESVLIEENKKSVNIKNPRKESPELHPDNYKEYLMNKKMTEKENIGFGYHKASKIDRTTEPRKQLDLYYDTEPRWDIRSFNKEYGYTVEEK